MSSGTLQRLFYLVACNLLLLQGSVHVTSFMINPNLQNRVLFTVSTKSLFQLLLEGFINIFLNFKINALSPVLSMYSSTSLLQRTLHFLALALDVNTLGGNWRSC